VLFLRPIKNKSTLRKYTAYNIYNFTPSKKQQTKINNLETETSEIIVQEDLQRLGVENIEA
jgi:hypothetical protein